jgi:hypothetical protein
MLEYAFDIEYGGRARTSNASARLRAQRSSIVDAIKTLASYRKYHGKGA